MAYTKHHAQWKDYPDLTTPLDKAALEHMEEGIRVAAATADTAASDASAAAVSAASAADEAAAAAAEAASAASLVSAPADSAVAAIVGNAASETSVALNSTYVPQEVTGTTVPTTLTLAAIQAAADAAATDGTRLVAAGEITTSTTLTLACDADLSLLTINYTGTATAVIVGTQSTTDSIFRKVIKTPTVIASNKSGVGWAGVAGTVGVEIANAYGCTITVTRCRDFETGLKVSGYTQGVGYCTVHLGHLDNNKTNMSIIPGDASGWENQNTFIGGRLSHDSAEGTETADVGHLAIAASVTHPVNNNTWLGTSMEGNTPALHADIAGVTNYFINCRWEATGAILPKVRWRVGATGNVIMGGYMAHQIVESIEAGSTSLVNSNVIISRGAWKFGTSNSQPGLLIMENAGDGTYPTDVVMAPGAKLASADPSTAYAVARSAYWSKFKRNTDVGDRVRIDHQNGRLYLGNGTAAPTRYIGNYGTTSIEVNGGHLAFNADNTYDVGLSGASRPRYVRAGTAVQTGAAVTASRPAAATAGAGAMFFDTTLNKPIWSTGAAWVDATGAAV